MKNQIIILFVRVLLMVSSVFCVYGAPYPQSDVIANITFDFSTHEQYGQGSDQWPMTWADDDNIYAGWGDGFGFDADMPDKQCLGITQIKGNLPGLTGEDTWGIPVEKDADIQPKPIALIAYGGSIYMFMNNEAHNWKDCQPVWSDDFGETWTLGDESVFHVDQDGVQVKGIVQYGRGYEGAPDNYVYMYLAWHYDSDFYLLRVSNEKIFDRSSYEYFTGLDEKKSPLWTSDFSQKQSVFHDDKGMIWHLSVSYNQEINRYLLSKPHFAEGDSTWEDVSSLGIFDAPTPWGPWTTVYYEDNFKDSLTKFNYFFPTKFISPDGKSMWLGWSGWPEYDNVNFVKATLTLTAPPSCQNQGHDCCNACQSGPQPQYNADCLGQVCCDVCVEATNPVLHLKFEEGSGTTAIDSSGNNNDGIINGATYTTGKIGSYALNFDGVNDFVNAGNLMPYSTSEITIMAWVKPLVTTSQQRVICKSTGTSTDNHTACLISDENGNIEVRINTIGGSNRLDGEDNTLEVNKWTHIAFTYKDGDGVKMYSDGSLNDCTSTIGTCTPTGNIPTSDQVFTIGNINTFDPRYFNGAIDEVRIYDRALTSSEIQNIYYSVSTCGPADNNPINGEISIQELIAFIGKWKNGQATIQELIQVIGFWKSGC